MFDPAMPLLNALHWSMLVGSLLALLGILLLAGGPRAAAALLALPRHIWLGRALAAIAWAASGWAVYVMPLSLLDPFKRYIPFIAAICVPLSWYWLDELLACRAIGGLLMLFPAPLLLALRALHSPARLLLISLAYAALTAGMVIMLYPWHMRRACHAMARSTALRLGVAAAAVAAGGAVIICGALALR